MEGLIENIKSAEFSTVEELYERKDEIKFRYQKMDSNTQRIYKWYFFYQLCLLDYKLKSLMWDYICDIGGSELHLRLAYLEFLAKKEKYHLKYILEEEKKKEL
jgi:hypothetical protein